MKKCLFLLLIVPALLLSEVHILYVSAVIPMQFEWRKQEYLESLEKLKSYGYEPWIIEATNVQSTYFDGLVQHVFYPNQNDLSLNNQGVNEARSIIPILELLPFDDEDIVVKLTGRYLLYERKFLDTLEENLNYDAYVKWVTNGQEILCGCFGMKWKYFKHMFSSWDLDIMEKGMINFERMVAIYLLEKKLNCLGFEKLFLRTRMFGKGNPGAIGYE